MEEELEGERRGKSTAVNTRKKYEAQVQDLEQQLELANRLKEDYNRQLKKLNVRVFCRHNYRNRNSGKKFSGAGAV
ncbi:MAG: hypothetical protein GY696_03155 [Gammaproteobacteria bacterium]|nr:hypothetical protein [Gammaproteobacteria bacterium]